MPQPGDLIHEIMTHLHGPTSPIGLARPLTTDQLQACEVAAGVALSPSLHALLSFDAGMMSRDFDWFDADMNLLARPAIEVIGEHAGPLTEAYEELCAQRFPGNAIGLDQGSDSMRLLYFGDPDDKGEYPVLFIDHDDMPVLGVEYTGFDTWLASELGLIERDEPAAEQRCIELLGTEMWEYQLSFEMELPAPIPGPAPGSVSFGQIPAPAAPAVLTDEKLAMALSEATRHGDSAEVIRLAGMVNERSLSSALSEAMIAAAQTGSTSAIRDLLAAGAPANAIGHYGSALSSVVHHPNADELVTILLEAGADPNGPSINGQTVIHDAVEHAPPEVIRRLLEAGADPERADSNGMTAIYGAVRRHPSGSVPSPSVVDILCAHGADPNGGTSHSKPLHWAIEDGLAEHADALIRCGADVNAVAVYGGRTPLHAAFEFGQETIVRILLSHGADRSIAGESGLAFTEIYGPDGTDIRPVTIAYAPSPAPQRITVEGRFAVLNRHHLAWAPIATAAQRWTAAGVTVVEQPRWDDVAANGVISRRWVLETAGEVPGLVEMISADVLGGALTFTGAGVHHTIRGIGLTIRAD